MTKETDLQKQSEANSSILNFLASFKGSDYASLFADERHGTEKEELAFSTIRVSKNNFEKTGEAFSILGDASTWPRDGATAYRDMIENGYFIEKKCSENNKTKIYPTTKLAMKMVTHFASKMTEPVTLNSVINGSQNILGING